MSTPANATEPPSATPQPTAAEFQKQEQERMGRIIIYSTAAILTIGVIWSIVYAYYDAWSIVWTMAGVMVVPTLVLIALVRGADPQQSWRLLGPIATIGIVAIAVALGGFRQNGGFIWWGILMLLAAAVFDRGRAAYSIPTLFLVLSTLYIVFNPWIEREGLLPDHIVQLIALTNIFGGSLITFMTLRYYVRQRNDALALLSAERERSERLLLNVLPASIAERLKQSDDAIADLCEEASVLFADIVGFTPMSERVPPKASVEILNTIFSHFDTLALHYGVEKIRTIGDGYMVASGIPDARADHAQVLVQMALDMRDYIAKRSVEEPPLQIRIGINSGAVVGGVIGTTKFHYDIWGDMVNVAARMESTGVPGQVHIAEAAHQRIKDDFVCRARGLIDVKGKGQMPTWFVERRLETSRSS